MIPEPDRDDVTQAIAFVVLLIGGLAALLGAWNGLR